jgi:hypothetical protein
VQPTPMRAETRVPLGHSSEPRGTASGAGVVAAREHGEPHRASRGAARRGGLRGRAEGETLPDPAGTPGDGSLAALPAGSTLDIAGFAITIGAVERLGPGAPLVYQDFGTSTSLPPQGQWVVIDVTYANTGTAPVSPGGTFDVVRVLTFAAGGDLDRQFDYDFEANSGLTYAANEASIYDNINPGGSLVIRYPFDVPADANVEAVGFIAGPVERGVMLPA